MGVDTLTCIITDQAIIAVPAEEDSLLVAVPCEVPISLYDEDPTDSMESLATSIATAISKQSDSATSVRLILPMHWAFTHILASSDGRLTPQSLAFDFEGELPVAVDGLTCVFVPLSDGRVLAAGLPTSVMQALLDHLEAEGVVIDHISVDAIAVSLLNAHNSDLSSVSILDGIWRRDLRRTADGPVQPILAHADSNRSDSVDSDLELQIGTVSQGDAAVAVWTSAAKAITRAAADTQHRLDFKHGALGTSSSTLALTRSSLQCAWLLAVLMLTGCAAMFHRSTMLTRHFNDIRAAEKDCYARIFESDVLPPAAAMRLASERRRLEGLAGTDAQVEQQHDSPCLPLELLRDWAVGLPADLRINLLHARWDRRQCTLRGRTTSHRDAERIVDTMNELPGIKARPPRTSRLDEGGVEFSIVAAKDPKHDTP